MEGVYSSLVGKGERMLRNVNRQYQNTLRGDGGCVGLRKRAQFINLVDLLSWVCYSPKLTRNENTCVLKQECENRLYPE